MSLESGSYTSDFNTSNPVDNTDTLASLGAQIRWVKTGVKNTLPNVTGPITVTHTQLNAVTAKAVAGLLTASGLTIATGKLAGRTTASTGALEEITIGGGLSMSSGTLSATVGNHCVEVHTGNGYGSTNTKNRRFTTALVNTGTAITYADSAGNGGSFTINEDGLYYIEYHDVFTSSGMFGVSLNQSNGTTAIQTLTIAQRAAIDVHVNGALNTCFGLVRCVATDVLRATAGTNTSTNATDLTRMIVRKVSA